MRPITVSLRFDYFENGILVIPANTEGTVINLTEPPTSPTFLVRFVLAGQNKDVWCNPETLIWRDGFLGPIRALVSLRQILLVDCDFTRLYSKIDIVVKDSYSYDGGSIDFFTDDGYIIRISSNLNNDISVQFLENPA